MKIKQYLKYTGMNHREFSLLVGISESYLSRVLKNQRTLSPQMAYRIMKATKGAIGMYEIITLKPYKPYK